MLIFTLKPRINDWYISIIKGKKIIVTWNVIIVTKKT